MEDLIDNILDEEWVPDEDGEDSADEENHFYSAEVAEVADGVGQLVDLNVDSAIHDADNNNSNNNNDNLVNDDHHDTNVSSSKRSRHTTIPTRYRE